jgi:aspartate-semialdehyde dehydrogenase
VGQNAGKNKTLYAVPSAPGLAAGRLLDALGRAGLSRLALIFFRPVSEAGRAGIEELESQTTQLLSFQSAGEPVFNTQVAFNLLDRYGSASRENLQSVRARIRREIAAAGRDLVRPSIQVLHAPVFYGYTFLAIAELDSNQSTGALIEICRKAGFTLDSDASSPLGNLNASGDSAIHLALPEDDSAHPGSWWFWGAADNIRLPAATAVKLAEKLIE